MPSDTAVSTSDQAAAIIETAFLGYIGGFHNYTLKARMRFETRDWLGALRDSAERLDLYVDEVRSAVDGVKSLLGDSVRDKATWSAIRAAYHDRVLQRRDLKLAESFFNSITRRIFTTVGVDPDVEFIATAARPPAPSSLADITETFPCTGDITDVVRRILRRYELGIGYEDRERDSRLVAHEIGRQLGSMEVAAVEMVRSHFFRNKGAYLVGRIHTDAGQRPIVLALANDSGRVRVEAVLLTEDEVSVIFSFTRSYFFVDAPCPAALVSFLRTIMPRKPPAELYVAIGHNKHAKTEFYRDLLRHLASTDEQFEIAPGARGMVMIVFTMPSYDVVFKVIKDRFDYPKTSTREDVMARYQLVFRHDRAGRLVDAQEFEHLEFERRHFSDGLLDELTSRAASTVKVTDTSVVVTHLYTERRLTPLDLYLDEVDEEAKLAAVLDYGQSLRDLAATNIFPGDLLLKNFGVTRHGRLVFYDYDELRLLDECTFRALPAARSDEDELSAEPWFYVGQEDVFPEEFLPFLGLKGRLRDVFVAAHGDLLTPEFWQRMQREHREGHVLDLIPYPPARRLHHHHG